MGCLRSMSNRVLSYFFILIAGFFAFFSTLLISEPVPKAKVYTEKEKRKKTKLHKNRKSKKVPY